MVNFLDKICELSVIIGVFLGTLVLLIIFGKIEDDDEDKVKGDEEQQQI